MTFESACVLAGAGLTLRPLQRADEPLYVGLFTSPEVMAGIGPPRTVDDARAAFARACGYNGTSKPGHRFWIASADGDDLGRVALVRDGASADLGIMFRPHAATARTALATAVDHAFGDLGLAHIAAEGADGGHERLSERLLRPYPFQHKDAPPGRAHWLFDVDHWRAARTVDGPECGDAH